MRSSDWSSDVCSSDLPDLETLGLKLPRWFDLVRIPFSLNEELSSLVALTGSDVYRNLALACADVVISGFPHGYSAIAAAAPEPEIGRPSCRVRVCHYV